MANRERDVERKAPEDLRNDDGVQIKAIAMLSGGLDSILAAAVVRRAGIDVLGLHVRHLFTPRSAEDHDPIALAAAAAGVPLRVLDRCEEHLEVIRRPRYGVGAGANPCIDCRIFVLREAAGILEAEGAQFVVTGEVLGQRPMSQHRQALDLVARRSGLEDRLFRPLSARLLPETLPVREGWVPLEQLPEIHGRGRSEQLALAEELGITYTPQPAGGCLLVEKVFAARVRDAFEHLGADRVTREEFELLRVGRQFRLSATVKLIVGRDERENEVLLRLAGERAVITARDVVGPVALLEGQADDAAARTACALAARYSDHEGRPQLTMVITRAEGRQTIDVAPMDPDNPRIAAWRIA